MNTLTGYLGTYASPESLGIYRFTMNLETGALTGPELYYPSPDCKYLSLDGSLLAAPEKQDGKAGLCLLDTAGGKASFAGAEYHETSPACYVTQDSAHIYTANYHEGSVLIYMKSGAGLTLTKRIDIAPKAGCHQIFFFSHYMMVPCLLLDAVKIFDCDNGFSPAGELTFPKGTGPRHGIFDRDQRRLFLVSELSNQLFVYEITSDTGNAPSAAAENDSADRAASETTPTYNVASAFQLQHVYSLLPEGAIYKEPPASAAIRLSADERFLYVSTRFAEIISVFAVERGGLRLIQQTDCGGIHPRDIALTPDGSFLLAVNRTRGGLVSFRVDPESGRLTGPCSSVPAPEAVSVVFAQETQVG